MDRVGKLAIKKLDQSQLVWNNPVYSYLQYTYFTSWWNTRQVYTCLDNPVKSLHFSPCFSYYFLYFFPFFSFFLHFLNMFWLVLIHYDAIWYDRIISCQTWRNMLKIGQMSQTLSDKSDEVIPWIALASSRSKTLRQAILKRWAGILFGRNHPGNTRETPGKGAFTKVLN